MGEPEVFQSVAESLQMRLASKNGYRNGRTHDNDWGSVYCENRLVCVSARRTQSTHKTVTRGPWLPQKGAFGTSGVMEDYKVGPLSPLSKGVTRAKTSDHKKGQNPKA